MLRALFYEVSSCARLSTDETYSLLCLTVAGTPEDTIPCSAKEPDL